MFFDEDTIEKIKKKESPTKIIENFISKKEVEILKNIHSSSKNHFVDRFDGTKTSLGKDGGIPERNFHLWKDKIKEIIIPKMKKYIGKFSIHTHEFPPHFFHTWFPTKVHADTGRDPAQILGKQILIPLLVNGGKANTIVFKNKWYGQASNFTSKENITEQEQMNHGALIDSNKKFIQFDNIYEFYNDVKNQIGKTVNINDGKFIITNDFLKFVKSFTNKERYNRMTNKHILNNIAFNKKIYNKYLTHQNYDDLQDLEVETIYEWNIGSALIWDRARIHSSDNYLINGVKSKIGLSVFTNYNI